MPEHEIGFIASRPLFETRVFLGHIREFNTSAESFKKLSESYYCGTPLIAEKDIIVLTPEVIIRNFEDANISEALKVCEICVQHLKYKSSMGRITISTK